MVKQSTEETKSLIKRSGYRRERSCVTVTTGVDSMPDEWREARAIAQISAQLALLEPGARERVVTAVSIIAGGGNNLILAGVLRRLTQDEILP